MDLGMYLTMPPRTPVTDRTMKIQPCRGEGEGWLPGGVRISRRGGGREGTAGGQAGRLAAGQAGQKG